MSSSQERQCVQGMRSFSVRLLSTALQVAPTNRPELARELKLMNHLYFYVSHLSFLVNSPGLLNSFFDSYALSGREVPYLVGWVVGTGSI